MVVGTIASQLTTLFGLAAAAIATGGFISHAPRVLSGRSESEIRRATVKGGLLGLAFVGAIIVLSTLVEQL
jgi:hypothetical protein